MIEGDETGSALRDVFRSQDTQRRLELIEAQLPVVTEGTMTAEENVGGQAKKAEGGVGVARKHQRSLPIRE